MLFVYFFRFEYVFELNILSVKDFSKEIQQSSTKLRKEMKPHYVSMQMHFLVVALCIILFVKESNYIDPLTEALGEVITILLYRD